VQIVSPVRNLTVPTVKVARVTYPDGAVREMPADKWGTRRIRPMKAAAIQVESGAYKSETRETISTRPESDVAMKAAARVRPHPAGDGNFLKVRIRRAEGAAAADGARGRSR